MCQPCSARSHQSPAPTKAARWLAFVLLAVTIAWTATMAASLHWRFLDRFVASTFNPIGLDFFQCPCGFKNLVAGNSIFLTEISDYYSFAPSYYNHPMLAVVVGPWTAPLAPYTAYYLFVAVSLALLAAAAWLLASAFESPVCKAFAYFAMFCSPTMYLLLWSGQMHVFLVVAVSLILAGLMRLAQEPKSSERYLRWIQAGILISLFSKPAVFLMLPALFFLPETRRKILTPVAIYAVASLLFLLVPRLNPGWYNATHWLNLLQASLSPSQTFCLTTPHELNYANSCVIFSLPRLLFGHCSRPVLALIVAIPLATILAMSLAPLLLSDRIHRIRATATAVALCVLSHYLCFFITFEYHYVTLLPLLPLLVWLRRGEAVRWLRGLLTAALLATAMVLLPTLRFLSADPEAYWLPNALLHVVPVAVAFVLLAIYGIASTQLRAHGTLLECGKRIIASLQASERSMAAIGILLAAVFTAAFATVPERLLTTPSQWKQADWNAHFEDIVSRPGVKPRVEGIMHYTLAMAYAAKKPELAMRHYAAAYRLTQDRDLLTLEMAESFRDGRRNDLAAKLLATLSADKMRDPKLRQKFAELRPTAGMTDSKKQTNH